MIVDVESKGQVGGPAWGAIERLHTQLPPKAGSTQLACISSLSHTSPAPSSPCAFLQPAEKHIRRYLVYDMPIMGGVSMVQVGKSNFLCLFV